MGKLESTIQFTGSMGTVTAYKMRGVEGIVTRKKSGASKSRIKNDPEFIRTRELNAEFAGRSTTTRWIMGAMYPLKSLADYNIAGPLNALLRPIQVDDPINNRGERAVELSKSRGLLEGFSLNRKILFESIVRAPVSCTLVRETMTAEVSIPALTPDINFKPQGKHPLYSFQACLGMVPDMFFSPDGYKPLHEHYPANPEYAEAGSEWFPTPDGSDPIKLLLKFGFIPPDNRFTLMLSLGIRYGYPVKGNFVDQVKYAGAAKVFKVA